jgi:hypothetical protein
LLTPEQSENERAPLAHSREKKSRFVGKKKFIDGLESLFLDAKEGSFSKNSPLLLDTESRNEPRVRTGKTPSGKHFSDDLDMFFQESLRDSIQDELSSSRPRPKINHPRPKDGLDSLIRLTIETSEIELKYDDTKKRVAFSFDQEKLEKLKHIARMEKKFLKDIIARVVADYIREYEQKKGKLD